MYNKIKLYASVQLPLEQIRKGFKTNSAGCVSQGIAVVLCQTHPFFVGFNQRWFEVVFTKAIDEIFVDIDDYDYHVKRLDDDAEYLTTPWSQLGVNPDDDEAGQYGAFVYEVKPDEIVSITEVHSDDNDICLRQTT